MSGKACFDINLGDVTAKAGVPQIVHPVVATIQIGTVQKGDQASVVNSGTPQHAIFDFVLPKGDKGADGLDGKDGVNGTDGKSAYEQAVEGGYAGTEAQFNEELGSFGELAQEAQTAAETAQSAAEEAEASLTGIKSLQKRVLTFTAGTPSGDYDGSLTTFPAGVDLDGLSVTPFVNGQRKDSGEYTLSGGNVVFGYTLETGDRVVLEINDIIRTAETADVDAAISAHNSDEDAHPALEARIAALEEGGSGGSSEAWMTWSGEYYSATQLSAGLSSGKSSAGALGVLAGKTITKIEAWAGNGTEGNPYFHLPWSYGWHISGNFLTLYYNRPGLDMDLSSYYTNSSAINVVIRVYYK